MNHRYNIRVLSMRLGISVDITWTIDWDLIHDLRRNYRCVKNYTSSYLQFTNTKIIGTTFNFATVVGSSAPISF